MRRKTVSGLLYLGMAFTLLTGCGTNNGNMDGTADMASGNGTLQSDSEVLQEMVTVQVAQEMMVMLEVI